MLAIRSPVSPTSNHSDDGQKYLAFDPESPTSAKSDEQNSQCWWRKARLVVLFTVAVILVYCKLRATSVSLPSLRRVGQLKDSGVQPASPPTTPEPRLPDSKSKVQPHNLPSSAPQPKSQKTWPPSTNPKYPKTSIQTASVPATAATPAQTKRIEEIRKLWRQDRSTQRFGIGSEYANMNNVDGKIETRKRRWQALQDFKAAQCGGFAAFVEAHEKSNSAQENPNNWRVHRCSGGSISKEKCVYNMAQDDLFFWLRSSRSFYCESGAKYMDPDRRFCLNHIRPKRYICEGAHPSRVGTKIAIERLGPYRSTGGYDWTSIIENDLAELSDKFNSKNMVLVGGMSAPVDIHGKTLGFPPIHIHHAHIYPYTGTTERREKIPPSRLDGHEVMFQAHGDSECKIEDGGLACLLHELDESDGFIVNHTHTGLGIDVELNDLRPAHSETLEWYLEVVAMYTEEKPKNKATYLSFVNQCMEGPCTYPVTLDPSSSMYYYTYDHRALQPGWAKNWIIHTHMTFADTLLLFKGDGVNEAVAKFVGSKTPLVYLDCLKDGKYGDVDSAVDALVAHIRKLSPEAQLICEMTKPGVAIECAGNETDSCRILDKRSVANCLKDPVRMEVGDKLTSIAFNTVRPHGLKRGSAAFKRFQAYTGIYAGLQHNVFRADYINDPDNTFTPPSYFQYPDVLGMYEVKKVYNTVEEAEELFFGTCPKNMHYSLLP